MIKIESLRELKTTYCYLLMSFASLLLALLCCFPKSESFQLLNLFHCKGLDQFFIHITWLGDGIFILLIIIIITSEKKYLLSLKIVSAYLISGLIVQIIKNIVDIPRPASYFNGTNILKLVDGITYHHHSSFPSGHTTTAFAVSIIFAFNGAHKHTSVLLFILAFLVGYSRIYLGQHFPEDVLAGMIIGSLIGIQIHFTIPKIMRLNLKAKQRELSFQ